MEVKLGYEMAGRAELSVAFGGHTFITLQFNQREDHSVKYQHIIQLELKILFLFLYFIKVKQEFCILSSLLSGNLTPVPAAVQCGNLVLE